jgi:hypothetical protein
MSYQYDKGSYSKSEEIINEQLIKASYQKKEWFERELSDRSSIKVINQAYRELKYLSVLEGTGEINQDLTAFERLANNMKSGAMQRRQLRYQSGVYGRWEVSQA